jgi:hypothetical protein
MEFRSLVKKDADIVMADFKTLNPDKVLLIDAAVSALK